MKKEALVQYLSSQLQEKVGAAQEAIASTKAARDSDTKSSAGDKHEVGREMAQRELDVQEAQLSKTEILLHVLKDLPLDQEVGCVGLGSLVVTDMGTYFISIGIGQIEFDEQNVFVISLASPIGQLLNGKKKGETISFNGNEIKILEVN